MGTLEQVIVVGGSLAGLRAAEGLRQLGFGGRLVFVGAEEREPYDRPPLSKEVLQGEWEPEKTSLVRGDSFEKLELDLRLGRRALALHAGERRLELDDGESIPFDGLVIATGAAVRTLPGTPDHHGIHTLRDLDDCLSLRADLERGPSVAVVGAGFIGAEVAASCRARGLAVTMIEALPTPLGHVFGPDIGETIAAVHRDQGVDLRCGVSVASIEGGERVERVHLSDGSEIDADVVVVGIGVSPVTDWLEGSGVETGDGVLCDETCQTSVPGVVAAGDVARWHNPLFEETMRVEHWSNAVEMGRAAAERLLAGDGEAKPFEPVPFFWSDQYDVKIQFAGRTTDADESVVALGSLEERKFVKLFGRKGRLVGALAFNMPRDCMKYRRLLRDRVAWDAALPT